MKRTIIQGHNKTILLLVNEEMRNPQEQFTIFVPIKEQYKYYKQLIVYK